MKRTISVLFALVLAFATTFSVYAAKPEGNRAGVEQVAWNLSADVMPVPPYGSRDIPGSDTSSKLLVNQPNGNTKVTVTGVMRGLNPNTTYTVYLSKGYTPYVYTGWNLEGNWVLRAYFGGGTYDHDYTITDQQPDGSFVGTGGYPAGGPYTITEVVFGQIDPLNGELVEFHSTYNNGYWYEAAGNILPDGTIEGTWGNDNQGYGHTWVSLSGAAVETHTGDTGWPGLFTSTIQPFTFVTDESGEGSWHVNMKASNFPGPGTYLLSVWINEAGATMLISDTFEVVVE